MCVVTTRYSLPDLRAFWQTTAPEVKLLRLSRDAGVHLLQTLGVRGTAQEFATLVEDVKGHALTLTLLGGFLKRAFHGDIRQRDRVKFEKADEKMDGGHAFRTMAAYEQWLLRDGGDEGRREVAVLRLMGLFDRPADAGCLTVLRSETIPGLTEPLAGLADEDWEYCLSGLETAKLLTVNRDTTGALVSLDTHPHIREYFAKQVKWGSAGVPPAAVGVAPTASKAQTSSSPGSQWDEASRRDAGLGMRDACAPQTTDAWRAAHRRLYEHLCATTPDKPQPTLEDLQPLYQAVAHGCQAGLIQEAHDEVHLHRIRRGWQEDYYARKLGAFCTDLGAYVCFFEQPWSIPAGKLRERDQAILLSMCAYRLRFLGRLTEALEPMRVGVDRLVKQQDWFEAAKAAGNLSELELTLGEVAGAVGDAEKPVDYADRSGDAFWKLATRATHADALHQAGRRAEAETRFREAEHKQAERQPDYPLLYSLQGFRYCDLLLAAPERAAWQRVLESRPNVLDCASPLALSEGVACADEPSASVGKSGGGPPHSKTLREVRERAVQTLKWAEEFAGAALLDFALDHLTLGRAALYAAILQRSAALRAAATPNDPNAADSSDVFFPAEAAAGRRPALQSLAAARRELDAAVAGLRRAGQQIMLPHSLLTRAWLRILTGARTGPERAQADLDEAWEIAARGPMKLFLADIHLHRARLFGRQKEEGRMSEYPWPSPQDDLAAARKLIESCGYGRRKDELEDAEKVILGP